MYIAVEQAQRDGVIRYYQHCGARLTALRYRCPPMIAGVTPEINYYLMLWSSVWTETNLPYPLARNLILAGLSENGAPIGSNAVWEALRHTRELYAQTLAIAS